VKIRRYLHYHYGPITSETVAREVAREVFVDCYGARVLKETRLEVFGGSWNGEPTWIIAGTPPSAHPYGIPLLEITRENGVVVRLFRTHRDPASLTPLAE
jgi:hypothetical protein